MSMKRGAEKDGTAREARAFHNWRGRGAAVATVLVVLLSVVLLYLFSDGLSMPQSPFFSVLSPGDDPFIAQTEAGKCRIYFLDVGQGNATLFSVGDEGYVIVDTGPEDAEASLLAMLSELGSSGLRREHASARRSYRRRGTACSAVFRSGRR